MGVTFAGKALEDYCICGKPTHTVLDAQNTFSDGAKERGTLLTARRWGAARVSFPVVFTGTTAERRRKITQLGKLLDTTTSQRLVLPDSPEGWWYKAVYDGSLEVERYMGGDMAELTFTLTDPAAYSGDSNGNAFKATIPSGGSVTIAPHCTAPIRPMIQATNAVRDSSTGVWGVSYELSGPFVHVYLNTGSRTYVYIDCDEMTVRRGVERNYTTPTLDSDWLEMEPLETGSRTFYNDKGTGDSMLMWYERWL